MVSAFCTDDYWLDGDEVPTDELEKVVCTAVPDQLPIRFMICFNLEHIIIVKQTEERNDQMGYFKQYFLINQEYRTVFCVTAIFTCKIQTENKVQSIKGGIQN